MLALALAAVLASAWAAPLTQQAPAARGDDLLCLEDGRIFDGLKLERVATGVVAVFENGEVEIPDLLVMEALIEGESSYVPANDEERELVAEGKTRFEGRWISTRRRDEIIQKRLTDRRAAVASMLEHREWKNRYREETRHFRFEYTVPQQVFEVYRDAMEAYYDIFARAWRVKPFREQPKLRVCFYGDRDEFHRTGGAPQGVIGYFKFVGEFELNIYYDRMDPAATEDVLFHEANHYLQRLVDENFSYPHWPGEAVAEYYGASDWDPERGELKTGLIQEGRLMEIKDDLGRDRKVGLRELIETERMYQHYNWGWSLVHFLMRSPKYEKKFNKFFLTLARGSSIQHGGVGIGGLRTVRGEHLFEAFCDALGLDNEREIESLEKAWYEHIAELDVGSSRGLAMAAQKAALQDRPLRARRLFGEAIDAGARDPLVFHRFAELLVEEEERELAIDQWWKAIALDPMNAEYYYEIGRALAKSDDEMDKAEGQRLKKLAKEMDPDVGSVTSTFVFR